MKAQCRGRFSHDNATPLRRGTSIRLIKLRHFEDTKPALFVKLSQKSSVRIRMSNYLSDIV